jgi:hypothetical protein
MTVYFTGVHLTGVHPIGVHPHRRVSHRRGIVSFLMVRWGMEKTGVSQFLSHDSRTFWIGAYSWTLKDGNSGFMIGQNEDAYLEHK